MFSALKSDGFIQGEPTQSWRARGARLGVGGVAILLAIMTSVAECLKNICGTLTKRCDEWFVRAAIRVMIEV
jgi:hypothetical protein